MEGQFPRKIIHLDMDAFFASVEQRDNPDLKGKPVAVGGSGSRGVVAAASYEARKFGVFSAMPGVVAKRKCPNLVFVKPRFEHYREVSRQIRKIFIEYTDLVEPLSLDEAYLDVTDNKKGIESATAIAMEIRQKIFEETHLTASAGVSVNKFVAKVASDVNKPNGIKVVPPVDVIAFLEALPIEKFYGIGKVTAEKMRKMGIYSGADLKKLPELDLVRAFGKSGRFYFHLVRGNDSRPVEPNRQRKSVGAERTFDLDISGKDPLLEKLSGIASVLVQRLEKGQYFGKTITLKIRYSDFSMITRSKTFNKGLRTEKEIRDAASGLLMENFDDTQKIRLLGLTVSNLQGESEVTDTRQMTLDF